MESISTKLDFNLAILVHRFGNLLISKVTSLVTGLNLIGSKRRSRGRTGVKGRGGAGLLAGGNGEVGCSVGDGAGIVPPRVYEVLECSL